MRTIHNLILSLGALLFLGAAGDADRMVDVGGHTLRARVLGSGAPTVVFDAGLGRDLDSWGNVPKAIAEMTTVVVYDRAGLGGSELGPEPRDANAVARDLHALLGALEIGAPLVLVGHSLGGLHIRMYAHLFPDQVGGLVFIDPTSEWMLWSGRAAELQPAQEERFAEAPEGIRAEARMLLVRLEQVAAIGPPDDVPAVVLTAAAPPDIPEEYAEEAAKLGYTVEKLAEIQARKLLDHHRLAETLPRGEHVLATASVHEIHLEEPQLVIEAIGRVLKQVRGEPAARP